MLPNAWRLWQQAVDEMSTGQEAEDFQAVGVRLRECMVTFASEIYSAELVPENETPPKKASVVEWSDLLVNYLASEGGSSSQQLRSYCKKITKETWDLVNQLTHARNAGSYDAEIGIAAVSHFISTMTAIRMRWAAGPTIRCATCRSYRIAAGTCEKCGWVDPNYEEPTHRELSDTEIAQRLDSPCTPSSDISTFMSPEDYP